MKRLSFFDKFIFFINSVVSLALLLAYILPFIPPKTFPFLSLLSLGMPFLIIANLLFLLYWAIRLQRQVLMPLIVLLIGLHHVFSLFNYSTEQKNSKNGISIMSYNVRSFNRYQWIKDDQIPRKIKSFIRKEKPQILCIQDFYKTDSIKMDFPYSYVEVKGKKSTFGHAIFSQYPIIGKGNLNFPNTNNNAIFADIVVKEDTVRVFNVHFESLKIIPEEILGEEVSDQLIDRVGKAFVMQQKQTKLVLDAVKQSPHKVIICADMNNSAFSYIYRQIEENGFKDAFKEAGDGFGKTFDFDFIPLRIDVIFVPEELNVNDFQNYKVKLSDHYPIMARVKI